MHILWGAIWIYRESHFKSPPCRSKSAGAKPGNLERSVDHVTAKLKERVFGTDDQAEMGFERSGNGVERPVSNDRENSGVAVLLNLRNIRGLRRRSPG